MPTFSPLVSSKLDLQQTSTKTYKHQNQCDVMSCDWSLQNDAAARWKNLWRNKLHTVREHLLNYSLWCSVNLQGSNLPDLRMTKVSIYDWQHRSPTMKQERTWMRPRTPASIWKRKMSGIPRYSGNHQLDLLPPLRFKCQASSMTFRCSIF